MSDADNRKLPAGAWLPLACALAVMLCTFSMPGREAPRSFASLDPIALAKLAIRLGALALLAGRVILSWGHPRLRAVVPLLLPFGLFVAWAAASSVWSALPAVSLGQSLGLLTLLLLSANVALSWRDERDTSAVLATLSVGLLVLSAVTAAAHLISPDEMGLNRGELVTEGDVGLVHPSAAAGTAGVGVVVLVASLLLWGWPWARLLLVPGCVAHGAVLVLAASRTPLAVCAVLVLALLCAFLPRALLAGLALAASLAGVLYVALDPQWEAVRRASDAVLTYYQRGETTAESLSSISGRTELWEVVWRDFLASPVVGNGYFVTTRAGSTDVWGEPNNLSAHNLALQVLATTGLAGAALFVFALGYWAVAIGGRLLARPEAKL
jgi:O-antigen ligase